MSRLRAKRRYSTWVRIREAWPDVTFRDFLTHRDFAQDRM
jgi:hypothetical protein